MKLASPVPSNFRLGRWPYSGLTTSLLLACSLLLAVPLAWADSVAASVELIGADAQTSLLNDHLDIIRHKADSDLTVEELQRLFAAAPRQIRELLATEGYFSPSITPSLRQDGDQWRAQFILDRGLPTRIDGIEIRFTGAITEGPAADPQRIERLRQQWRLANGDTFRQADWDAAKNNLLNGLLTRDFPAAKIAGSAAIIDPPRLSAVLNIEIDSGPAFSFGKLEINGLQRYSQEMIDALNPIREGEPYSQEKLTELQARLQDSGYFRTAFATIEVDPANPQRVPVRVDLTENEKRRLAFGGGFSTDGGPRLQAKWLDRRFLGHDWRLESELRLDRQTRVLGGDLFFPARENGWRPSLGSHFTQTDIANESNDRLRIDARYTSPYKTDEQVWGVSYLTDRQRVADTAPNNRQALVTSYSYTQRRLDNLIMPSRGHVAAIELAGGPRGLLNEANLVRIHGRVNWLSPIVNKLQAVLRAQFGQVLGTGRNTVPGELLFRAGGDQSVRGYAYNSLGVEQNGAIVGGRVLGAFSAELVWQVTPAWGAAVFRDAGNAADNWREFEFKQGTGMGARWRSPIGPVNLDLAFGQATREMRLHFWVGYGF